MFETQTDTCVDTNWSLLFSYFNQNLNLSKHVMKINCAVVLLWHAEGHDYANKSTATAISCMSAKNHKWKFLFNKTTFYINHQQLSNTQLRCKFVQYIRLLLLNEIHTYIHHVLVIGERFNTWIVERNCGHNEMVRLCVQSYKNNPNIKVQLNWPPHIQDCYQYWLSCAAHCTAVTAHYMQYGCTNIHANTTALTTNTSANKFV
jgi:hypothetical protein